jgi:hypothetical protein
MPSTLTLEYFKVFLSWPVVVGVSGIAAMIFYRKELRGLINRIGSVKVAGFEFGTSQEAKTGEDASDIPAEPVAVDEPVPPEVANVQLAPAEKAQLEAAFQGERAAARMWEYRFLNYFFAPSTQNVLDWFVNVPVPATTYDAFDAAFINIYPSRVERAAILSALERHACIVEQGQSVSVTDKGREYANWNERKVFMVNAVLLKSNS